MDEKWYITASFEMIEEHREAAMAALKEMVEATRKEAGCISYILTQDRANPSKYMFLETWANEAALQAHRVAPHMKEFQKRMEGKRANRVVTMLQKVL